MKISFTISLNIRRGNKIEHMSEPEAEEAPVADTSGCADLSLAEPYYPLGFTPSTVEATHARSHL